MAQQLIPLAEAISALRAELKKAMVLGAGDDLQFEVGPVELELNLVVEREAKTDGKLQFKIFGWGAEAGASGTLGDQRGHKVKLVLKPLSKEGGSIKVSDKLDDKAKRAPIGRRGGALPTSDTP
jgi:hypothetical protein